MNKQWTNHEFRRLGSFAFAVVLVVSLVLAVAPGLGGGVAQAARPAAVAPGLGAATSFAVLGGSAVTNTGPSIVDGDLGVSPGTAISGFPPGIVNGAMHAADAVALQAQTDVTTAYNSLAGQPCNTVLTGQDLGGLTLVPGVYCFSSSAGLTGQLTLDAQGNSAAVWIFQIGSTLTTASGSSVLVINGGNVCNVFWQVGSSATLGTGTTFVGNILALASITLATGTNVSGRALARTAAVTMDTNHVSNAACGQVVPPATATATGAPPVGTSTPVPPSTPSPTNVPEPVTITLFGAGLVALAGYLRNKRAAGNKE